MHWHKRSSVLTTILILNELAQAISSNVTSDFGVSDARILSRRKRYIVFPEGSSLQLVFCGQITAIIPIGDIFLFGDTVALAWPLPTDPDFFHKFKDYKAGKRHDLNEIYYLDSDGKVIAKVPYKRKQIINPAFAKRSIDDQNTTNKEKLRLKLDRKKMHDKHQSREYSNQKYMKENSIKFHRSSRIGLYEKIEKLLTALGRNGRECVLYKLCEARLPSRQGTFLQELSRVVFTIPKGTEYEKEEHRDYDKAHYSNEECSKLYPGCNIEISDKLL